MSDNKNFNPAAILLIRSSIQPIVQGLLVIAKIIVKLTPSLKDDKVVSDIETALNAIGINGATP